MCSRIEFLYEVKLLDVENNVLHPVLKKFLLYKKRKFGKHAVDYDILVDMASDVDILILDINNDIVQHRGYRKKFKDLSRKQQMRRLNVIKNLLATYLLCNRRRFDLR